MKNELEITRNGQEINPKQKRAIAYLVAAKDIESGCRAAGISTTTYYDWIKNPVFADAIDTQRNYLITEAMQRLRQGIGAAVDKLLALVNSENEEVARKASTSIVEIALKMRESEEIEDRIESIEKIILERRTYR